MGYWVLRAVFGPLLRMLWRPRVRGLGHLPESGPVIVASNHLSAADAFVLPIVCPRQVKFLAKAELFDTRVPYRRALAVLLRAVGQVPLDRAGGKGSASSLKAGRRVLRHGGLLGVFPEGSRSGDRRLYRGHTGVARLAIDTGALVVPVALFGTDRAIPRGSMLPRWRRVGVRFGAALDFSRYAGLADDPAVVRGATDEIMRQIARLSGQEYVDLYSAEVKRRVAEIKARTAAELAARTSAAARPDGASR